MDIVKLSFFFFLLSMVSGQDVTVCKNPRIGLPCILTCSTTKEAETVKFYRNEAEVKACSVHVNGTDCYFRDEENGKKAAILMLKSLKKFDQGFWKCSVGESKGPSKELKPYSFKGGEFPMPEEEPSTKLTKISVKAHCVFPKPEFVIRYCSRDMCTGEGEMYFNGDCEDDYLQNYKYECTIDFDNPSSECESINPVRIQASIYANDHLVYYEFTKETYNGKGDTDDIYIYRPAFITVIIGTVFLIAVYCIMRSCWERIRGQRTDDNPSSECESINPVRIQASIHANDHLDSKEAEQLQTPMVLLTVRGKDET